MLTLLVFQNCALQVTNAIVNTIQVNKRFEETLVAGGKHYGELFAGILLDIGIDCLRSEYVVNSEQVIRLKNII